MKSLDKFWPLVWLRKLNNQVDKRVNNFGAQYIAFGIFGVLNYPIYYLIWTYSAKQSYESFTLRAIATLLCIPLVFRRYWPKNLRTWLPIYWYITLCYCLPFFFTYMLLKNNASDVWLMSTSTIFFWLVLLVDWASYIVILTLGILSACILFHATSNFYVPIDYIGIFAQYAGAIIVVSIFAHNKENLEHAKLKAASDISANIAHELRTPLGAIQSSINGVQRYYPILTEAYQLAVDNNLPVEKINHQHFNTLLRLLEDAKAEVHYSNTIIDMLLMNVGKIQLAVDNFKSCSIIKCIQEAIKRYPYISDEHKEIIHLSVNRDFTFQGNELLLIHVLFNLLKNALYYITAVGKGHVTIWVDEADGFNNLHFKDTAKGIPAEHMSKLFTRFFTTAHNGTGLGLAFCKMVMVSFGGNIICNSKEGEYAEFIMSFPKVADRVLNLSETALAS